MSDTPFLVGKYELAPGATEVSMPRGAKVLSVGVQGDGVFMWALIPQLSHLSEPRRFLVVGTGHLWPLTAFGPFIGTVFLGALMFHVFEGGDA